MTKTFNIFGHEFKITQDGPVEKATVHVGWCEWTIERFNGVTTISWYDGSSGETEIFKPSTQAKEFEFTIVEAFGEIMKQMCTPANFNGDYPFYE